MATFTEYEIEYLFWFFENADFGPAHEDVMDYMNEKYEEEAGKPVPATFQ